MQLIKPFHLQSPFQHFSTFQVMQMPDAQKRKLTRKFCKLCIDKASKLATESRTLLLQQSYMQDAIEKLRDARNLMHAAAKWADMILNREPMKRIVRTETQYGDMVCVATFAEDVPLDHPGQEQPFQVPRSGKALKR